MGKSNAIRLAIIGAGPIGLEAALYAQQLDFAVTLFERGRIGENLLRWGFVRLFTPFGMNSTPLGRKQLKSKPPADDAILTGREHVQQYLQPLADSLQSAIQTEAHVLKISRRDFLKSDAPGDNARLKSPFRLLVRDKQRERIEEADVVLDCTGTYGQHRWAGAGGIPCPGEIQAEPHIAFHLDDIAGDRKNHYAGRSILIVGSGYSAATSAVAVADLGREHPATWGVWIARGTATTPLRRIAGDPLRERDRLAMRANSLATRSDDNVEFHPGVQIDALEFLGADKGFRVSTRTPAGPRVFEVERMVANVGSTPDTNLYRELHIAEDVASLAPIGMAQALEDARGHDSLKIAVPGPDALRTPEPNFFILGGKSFGRHSTFLLRVGFSQIRQVFAILSGNPKLDLYK